MISSRYIHLTGITIKQQQITFLKVIELYQPLVFIHQIMTYQPI